MTDNYIKMCEQAEEIQKIWEPKIGDYVFNDGTYIITKFESDSITNTKMYRLEDINNVILTFEMESILKEYFTWLPTQEQLWKKMEKYMFNRKHYINMTTNWYNKRYDFAVFKLIDTEPDEYEELCNIEGRNIKECVMQIIMRIKYNKVWTGEKWENIERGVKS
jgi:hypothetical protein